MARMKTGAIDGIHVELVSETLEQHSVLTMLDEVRADRVREVLNRARDDARRILGSARTEDVAEAQSNA